MEYVRPSRWRKWWWWIAGGIGMGAFLTSLYFLSGWGSVAKQIAAIRARGEPITMDELAAYYPYPPAGQDATAIWMRGAKTLPGGGPVAKQLPFLGEVDRPPRVGQTWAELDLARQFLLDNGQAMQDLHDAAALGGQARYPIYFNGAATLLPHADWLRTLARCLALEANVRAHDGDLRGAAESIHAGVLLAESMANEPICVSQLVRMAVLGIMLEELKRLGPINLPAEELAKLQATLMKVDFATAMTRSIIGDRAMGAASIDGIGAMGLAVPLLPLRILTQGADKATYLAIMADFVAASELPWKDAILEMDNVQPDLRQLSGPFTYFTKQLAPGMQMIAIAFARGETLKRLAILDIAIARYQQKHGRPPALLADLAPEFLTPESLATISIDPTTDSPLGYKVTEAGHVVYSPSKKFPIGSNESLDAETGANPQLVFRWPPLPDPPTEPPNDLPTEHSDGEQDESATSVNEAEQ